MKKKAVVLTLCLACALFAGCGDSGSDSPKSGAGTEEALTEGTEKTGAGGSAQGVKSIEIEYDINDYVTLGDYMNMEVTLNESDYEVTEEKVTDYAEQMISYYCPYTEDETKTVVGENDIVDVDYVGKKDGEAFEGGTAEHQIIDVANNKSATTGTGFIEGFTSGLAGTKVGDTVDCDVTFPEDYQSEELAGQKTTFTFTVNSVQKPMTLETMDDAAAKKYFEKDTKKAFLEEVNTVLKSQMERQKQSDIRVAIINEATADSEIKGYPQGLLEARVDEYIAGFEKKYCSDGASLEDFITNTYGSTLEAFRQEVTDTMEENVKQEMVFEAIVKKEKIEFDEEGFQSYVASLKTNGGYPDEKALYESYGPDQEAGKAYMQKIYLQQKACQMIVENTKVNYEKKENG